ncbi:MAG: Asp-tRNA(Asn)/Glu-tRNA(Gln) amidotransferase subunit GatA [Patescibacteria group bacterium]|nr:Asp-tRNA(Asn)/Glu-tRNA(Gln) amidotransferase subunit GatA [Patescibacteria group bacterium]
MKGKLIELTIKEAHKLIKDREISAVELTEGFLARIRDVDAKIKAYLTVTPELALAQAKAVDDFVAKKQEIGLLAGIPGTIKDVLMTKGIQTTAASKILENFNPPYSATTVDKLLDQRAVLLGKTNCDEFAMGASTENSAYFESRNPWDLQRVPGGSSGGSAAAVAASEAMFALASDTGGSIRQPASFCGVVGLKPTYGRVSRFGLIAMASSFDTVGPITRDVKDAAIVLQEIAGSDANDSTSLKKDVPDYLKALERPIKSLKVGMPKEYFIKGIDPTVEKVVREAIKKIEGLGAELVEVSLPHTQYAIPTYYILVPSEVSSNMARFDRIRYGLGRDKFGEEVKRRIMLGTYALSSGYFDAYYSKAAKVRTLIKQDFEEVFKKVDILVTPTTPSTAFKFGENINDPLKMYLADIFTCPVNLAGVPAISIPCGFADGLPVGLQVIGPHFDEERVLNVAYHYEQSTDWHNQKPEI